MQILKIYFTLICSVCPGFVSQSHSIVVIRYLTKHRCDAVYSLKRHDFSDPLLCRFERANVRLCRLPQERPVRNPYFRFRQLEHDHNPVAFHPRCTPDENFTTSSILP